MQNLFYIQTFIKQLFTKYQCLTKLPQISHIHKNNIYFKYNWNFLDQLLLPYKFHGSDMWGMYFFIFASLWAVNVSLIYMLSHSTKHNYIFSLDVCFASPEVNLLYFAKNNVENMLYDEV